MGDVSQLFGYGYKNRSAIFDILAVATTADYQAIFHSLQILDDGGKQHREDQIATGVTIPGNGHRPGPVYHRHEATIEPDSYQRRGYSYSYLVPDSSES